MSGFAMRRDKKSASAATRSTDHSVRRKDRAVIPTQLRARLGALAYTHEIHPGGEARSTGVGRDHNTSESGTGKRVAIIQRMRNNVVQRCEERQSGSGTLSGKWKKVNESMSQFSKDYQKEITGQEGKAWVQKGVKFDGMKEGALVEAKGKYAQFINSETNEFYHWFSGKQSLIDQASRQIEASEGASIEWYFAEEKTRMAVEKLFKEQGITGITLIYKPKE